jgi:hypothetical protein
MSVSSRLDHPRAAAMKVPCGSSPAARPRRDERPMSPRKPGVQGGRGEPLNRVEKRHSRFDRPVTPMLEKQSFTPQATTSLFKRRRW